MQEEQATPYVNRRTVARAVRDKAKRGRARAVLYAELDAAEAALPSGSRSAPVRGRAFAFELLSALRRALRGGVKSIRLTAGRLVKRLINGGHLLRKCPPHRVTIRAALDLLREVTPLVRADGLVWTIALGALAAEDPDELEHDFEVWRSSKRAREEHGPLWEDAADGAPADASAASARPETAEIEPSGDASASSATTKPVTASHIAKPTHSDSRPRLRCRLPRVRARVGTFSSATRSPSAERRPARTRSALLAEVGAHRWVREAAAACLRHLEAETSLEAVFQRVIPGWKQDTVGRRGRHALRRAIRALADRGWLVFGERGWTVRPTEANADLALLGVAEAPSEIRPSRRMARCLQRQGVDPRGMSAEEARRCQRALHGRRRQERLTPRQLKAVVHVGGGLAGFDEEALRERFKYEFIPVLRQAERERRLDERLEPLPESQEVAAAEAGGHRVGVRGDWSQIVAWVGRYHGARAAYGLQLNGGGGNLPALVRDASAEDIASCERVIRETRNPVAVVRRLENHLRAGAVDTARATPEVAAEPYAGIRDHWLAQVAKFLKGD